MNTNLIYSASRWMVLSFMLGMISRGTCQTLTEEYNECAIECFSKMDYEGAISFYTEMINLNPMDETAYFDRGFVKELIEDYQGAIQDFTQQIAIDSEHVDSYFLRGIIWDKKKEYEKAIIDYSSVIQLEDGNADAHYFRGLLKEKQKDLEGAYIDYSEAIRVNPEHTNGYIHRAWIHVQRKSFLEAEKDLQRAIDIDSTNVQAYYYLGFIQAEQHHFDLAVANYLKAVRIDPFFDMDYPTDVMKNHSLRDYSNALNHLTKSASISKLELALLNHYVRNEESALKFIDLAINGDSTQIENKANLYFFKARIHFRRFENTLALKSITSSIDLSPTNPLFYYTRALIFIALDDYEKACVDYEKEIKLEGYAKWYILPNPCTN